MKTYKISFLKKSLSALCMMLLLVAFTSMVYAQSDSSVAKPVNKPVKRTFENAVLINNQTVENPGKKSLDFIIQHRFGIIKNSDDLFGFFAPSNIRLGLTYGLTDRLALGIGATKNQRLYDFQGKYILLKQTKSGNIPVTVSYYGDVARSAIDKSGILNQDNVYKATDRLSYFHELMIARKITSHLSLQLAGTYSYFNIVDTGMQHEAYGISFAGRYQFSPQSSFIVDYDYPITTHGITTVTDPNASSYSTLTKYYPYPNLGIGMEVATSSHTFQVFVCTADAIINQVNRVYNQNDFTKREIMIGFNITRQWGF